MLGSQYILVADMGREAVCTARFGGKSAAGKALLETREVVFRAPALRLTIPFDRIEGIAVKGGALTLKTAEGPVVFELGKEAEAWAKRIKNPPGRLDKLGVKPGLKVSLVGEIEPAFVAELEARTEDVSRGKPRAASDLIFFAAEAPSDLDRLATLKKSLQPAGALWLLRRKGPDAPVTESAVMAAGKAAGLVDTKVVSFSDTHTAERLVIPVARR
jgi:hypothetical protein